MKSSIIIPFVFISLFSSNIINLSTSNSNFDKFDNSIAKEVEWTEEALPTDFFGDYNHPEFWINTGTNEIFYEKPQTPGMYDYYPEYEGKGITTFTNYTKSFNQAIINGYDPYYKDRYINTIESNPNGFKALNSNWTLLDFSSYMEDWIIWNWNEVLDKDKNDSSQKATNSGEIFDISFWGYTSYDTINEMEENGNGDLTLKEIEISNLGINSEYYLSFEKQPIFSWSEDQLGIAKYYSTYKLEEKILPPTEKESILDANINYSHYHEWLQSNLDQGNEFKTYKDWFEKNIILELNKDFIEEYGESELGHDYNQGYHQIEDIRLDDLDITYYELENNTWKEIEENKYDENLSNFLEIKTVVKTKNTNIFFNENEEISFTLNVKEELKVPEKITNPGNKQEQMMKIIEISMIVLIVLSILISIPIYFIFFRKNN